MYRAVFLDRDNTIIHNDDDLGDPQRVNLIQGAASAIASLRGLGYKVVVVTNQGGVARGKYGEADVDAVNRRINELVKKQSGAMIDRFYYCPYHPQGTVESYKREHPWRKPQPGMLLQAAMDMNLDLRHCWMVGDQARDVEAGRAASTRTILLRNPSHAAPDPTEADHVVATLAEAARVIAERHKDASPAATEGPDRLAIEPVAGGVVEDVPLQVFDATIVPAPLVETHSESTFNPVPTAAPNMEVPTLFTPDKPQPKTASAADPQAKPIESPARPFSPPVGGVPPRPRVVPTGASDPDPPSGPRDSQAQLLAQILRELKQHHVQHDDFSWARLAAVLLQTMAAGFLCIALFNWRGDYFFDWLMLSILGQLAVIASLLCAKNSRN